MPYGGRMTIPPLSFDSKESGKALPQENKEYPLGPLDLDGAIGDIYQGVMETPPWKGALEKLRALIHADHATLMLRPPSPESTGVMINTGDVDEQATESYETHFFALDPIVGLPEGEVVSPEEAVGRERWLNSEMYKEYIRPLGIRHMLTTDLHTDEGVECRIRVTRQPSRKAFTEKDKMALRVLLPHFKRAISLHTRMDYLECERQVFAGAMNRLLLGMVNFAGDGTILETNQEAERILAEKDGIWRIKSRLKASNREENKELQRLIRQAVAGGVTDTGISMVEAMSVTRRFERGRLGIVVRSIPMGPWSEGVQRPAAALFLRDPDYNSAHPSENVVRRVFGLTRMEAALAVLLAKGFSLDDAAEELGVRRNTARTHLRSIFGKTGVSRQTMLVRMILKSVVSLGN